VTAGSVAMAHLGVGAFARSLPLWLADRARRLGDVEPFTAAAFTGRGPAVARQLNAHNGAYHLVTRSAIADEFERVDVIDRAYPGGDLASWAAVIAAPSTELVTITITEHGYAASASGGIDHDSPSVQRDLQTLGCWFAQDRAHRRHRLDDLTLETAAAKLLWGLGARMDAGVDHPIVLASCDNLPRNGRVLRAVVADLAEDVAPEVGAWMTGHVEFAETSVDRITPAWTSNDQAILDEHLGVQGAVGTVAEPYYNLTWSSSGSIPLALDRAGVTVVDDVQPYVERKLRMLNGAHTLMALHGLLRGRTFIHEAAADPVIRQQLERWWDDVESLMPSELAAGYREVLLERFDHARLPHRLDQIALDTDIKIGVRVVPVVQELVGAGRDPGAGISVLAAWVVWASRHGRSTAQDEWTWAELLGDQALAELRREIGALTRETAG